MFKENIEKQLRIALYTRVSTEDQAKEGFSLEAQLKKLRAYCISKDWEIYKEYIEDGYSGRNTRRPKYTEMFEDIDHWDGILVLKMDRIHRNSKNFMDMMDDLKKHSKEFISCVESLDTSSAMGRFVMDIIQRIAQLESEQIGERVTFAMVEKALDINKGYAGGRPPFGYKFNEGEIINVSNEQEIIKKVFQLYSEGHSIHEVAKLTGKAWSQVRYWLNNVFYIGLHQWGNCFKKTKIEPLITLDLWNLVQTKKRKARGGPTKKPLVMDELPDTFTLTDKQMRDYGFTMNIIKNQVK